MSLLSWIVSHKNNGALSIVDQRHTEIGERLRKAKTVEQAVEHGADATDMALKRFMYTDENSATLFTRIRFLLILQVITIVLLVTFHPQVLPTLALLLT